MNAEEKINTIFKVLCSMENDIIRPKVLTIMGRNVTFNKTCGQVIDATFNELCARVCIFKSFHCSLIFVIFSGVWQISFFFFIVFFHPHDSTIRQTFFFYFRLFRVFRRSIKYKFV